ncbi:MAG TPA: gamma-glutamyl-gamma-aminobutyrate hydrolase family protein, partial [Gemmatimonadaceae bacterium]|nr:gamma-glutamyl-gamma-aminobutyrate hydrolase family protein [Gemmatimonadaceae bacterium]
GISINAIRVFGGSVPILGVCLGHQAIAEAYGCRVVRAPVLMHGKISRIHHGARDLFQGLPSPLEVMRYHSLTVDERSLPPELEILAWGADDSREIQALRHRIHPVWGVQFHPESVMTQSGIHLIENFLRLST